MKENKHLPIITKLFFDMVRAYQVGIPSEQVDTTMAAFIDIFA
jgi:hypothetical protein